MLHRVTPDAVPDFSPNRILNIRPCFLETTIRVTREAGFEFVSMGEAVRRLRHGSEDDKPFAVITFDDGYKDNAQFALPILKRHDVPATIYMPSAYADGCADYWWLALEEAIRRTDRVQVTVGDEDFDLPAQSTAEKNKAYHNVYWALRHIDEVVARETVAQLAASAGYDPGQLARDLPMTWDELRAINAEPLVTIGGHTENHFALGKLSAAAARQEMYEGARRLEAELQVPIEHFSFPYGDLDSAGPRDFELAKELGFKTAVTTQKGLIAASDAQSDCFSLKRLSINGDYQRPEYLRVLLSGLPFDLMAMTDRARRSIRAATHRIVGKPMRPAGGSTSRSRRRARYLSWADFRQT